MVREASPLPGPRDPMPTPPHPVLGEQSKEMVGKWERVRRPEMTGKGRCLLQLTQKESLHRLLATLPEVQLRARGCL